MTDEKPEHRPRGPEPEHLKVDGDWEEAVKKALRKKPPATQAKRKKTTRRRK